MVVMPNLHPQYVSQEGFNASVESKAESQPLIMLIYHPYIIHSHSPEPVTLEPVGSLPSDKMRFI